MVTHQRTFCFLEAKCTFPATLGFQHITRLRSDDTREQIHIDDFSTDNGGGLVVSLLPGLSFF